MNADQYERLRPDTDLIKAFDALREHPEVDGLGIELALDFEFLALECGANPDWSRQRLINHQRARAGREGGLATIARYGRAYYRALARACWGVTPKGALPAIREALSGPAIAHLANREKDRKPTDQRGGGEEAA